MAEEPERGWLASRLLPGGSEPDARFTLANEQTFLAWTRTSLAFLAGGIALETFASELLRQGLSTLVICIGMLVSFDAFRWVRVEDSMRTSGPSPAADRTAPWGRWGALGGNRHH